MTELSGSTTDQPTPDQRVAREFWTGMAQGSLLSLYVMAQLAEIADGDYDDDAGRMAAYQNLLKRLRYPKLEVLLAEYEATSRSELGFWAGRYALIDAEQREYVLQVNDHGATLRTGETLIDKHTFTDGVLRLEGEQLALELRFSAPADPGSDELAAALARPGQPRCVGTVRLAGDSQPVAIRGKRGCYSAAGIDRDEDGDPPELWSGGYSVLFTDTFEWASEEVNIGVQDGKLVLAQGKLMGSDVRFANNGCMLHLGAAQLAARFEVEGGRKQFYGALLEGDQPRPVTAYLTRRPAAASAGHAMVRGALHRAALRGDGPTTVTLDPSKTTKTYVLPVGHGGRAYTGRFKLAAGHGFVAPIKWEKAVPTAPVWEFLELRAQLAPNTDTATLDGAILEGTYAFSVKVTDSSTPTPRSATFAATLAVEGKPRPVVEIDLQAPGRVYDLPDAMESNHYAVDLRLTNQGSGNAGKFTWVAGNPSDSVWDNVVMRPVGKTTATLVGSIRPHVGKGHNPFTIKVTSSDTIELKLNLEIMGLRLIEISSPELRPVTLRREFKAELTAAGGRDPYKWELLDFVLDDKNAVKSDAQGNPYFGVEGLTFATDPTTGKATIAGTVSDPSKSGVKMGVRVAVQSAPTLIMDTTTETLYVQVVEPEEQAKDIQGWVAFGILLFVTGIPVVGFLKSGAARPWTTSRGPNRSTPTSPLSTRWRPSAPI